MKVKELLQLKEQNRKMSSENKKMEITVDQLQAQLSTQDKETEKLVRGIQDKTGQLEHLKKENDHLFLSLSEQRRDQKLRQTVEEMEQNETTAVKKQQELMEPGGKKAALTVEQQLAREVGRLKAKLTLHQEMPHGKADDSCDHTLEQQQMQALCLNCPICGKTFPAREKQIFEDYV
ncbi:hypothetical protein P7K49_003227, partial [Saguinus oedipus]